MQHPGNDSDTDGQEQTPADEACVSDHFLPFDSEFAHAFLFLLISRFFMAAFAMAFPGPIFLFAP